MKDNAPASAAKKLIEEISELLEDAIIASELIGLFSPWVPEEPPLTKNVELSIAGMFLGKGTSGGGWRWPKLQEAVKWLQNTAIVSYDELKAIAKKAKDSVFESGTLTDPLVIEEVRNAVAESLEEGDSLQRFRDRVDEFIALPKAQTETIFRTNTKRAYLAGQEAIIHNPAVRRVVTYMLFRATDDGRVRPMHWHMHNWIAEVDSPLHQLFIAMQSDYNCRCGMIPVSERRLAGREVRTIDEVPSEIRRHYGF